MDSRGGKNLGQAKLWRAWESPTKKLKWFIKVLIKRRKWKIYTYITHTSGKWIQEIKQKVAQGRHNWEAYPYMRIEKSIFNSPFLLHKLAHTHTTSWNGWMIASLVRVAIEFCVGFNGLTLEVKRRLYWLVSVLLWNESLFLTELARSDWRMHRMKPTMVNSNWLKGTWRFRAIKRGVYRRKVECI